MKILVKVRPGAKRELVEQVKQEGFNFVVEKKDPSGAETQLDFYRIWVKEPAVDGRANQAVIQALAKHLNISAGRIKIKSGRESRQKVIEVT